jgi:hypothetical protein
MLKQYLSIEQVAERTGYTLGSLRQFSASGDLPPPAETIGCRHFYLREDIAAWLQFNRTNPRRRPYKQRRKK